MYMFLKKLEFKHIQKKEVKNDEVLGFADIHGYQFSWNK